MRIFAVVALVAAGGCSTVRMVQTPGAAYGPVNHNGGIVEYQMAHAGESADREDAYKQMWGACRGSYQIDGEYVRDGATIAMANPELHVAAVSTQAFREIRFSCVAPPATVAHQ